MNKCPHCGHENRVGELICANCGKSMAGEVQKSTHQLGEDSAEQIATEAEPTEAAKAVASGENAYFPENATLRLEIIGSPMPIKVKFTKTILTLGRRDPATGSLPDVDLAPFAGYRMGVSRRHSEIRRNEDGNLELLDLGSSNGTFLNGRRLTPHTPYLMQNRDRMALGQIVMEVLYQVDTSDISTVQSGKKPEIIDPTQPSRPNDPTYLTHPQKPENLAQALEDAKLTVPKKPKNQTRMLNAAKSETTEGKEPQPPTRPVDKEQVKKVQELTSKLTDGDELKKKDSEATKSEIGETRDVDQVSLSEKERKEIFGDKDKKEEKKPDAETVKLAGEEAKAAVDDIKQEASDKAEATSSEKQPEDANKKSDDK